MRGAGVIFSVCVSACLLSIYDCTGVSWRRGRIALACKNVVSPGKVRRVQGCSGKGAIGERKTTHCFNFFFFFYEPFQPVLSEHHHWLGSS